MLSLLLLACASHAPPAPPEVDSGPDYAVLIEVTENQWSFEYQFAEPVSALLLDTAHGPWRAQAWIPEPGVRLERSGALDLMVLDPPARRARFTLDPEAAQGEGTPPLLRFGDGGAAFYTGQLAVLTVESHEAALALEGDLGRWRGEQPPVQVRVRADQPLLGPEGAAESLVVSAQHGAGPYVYVGPGVEGQLVLDPTLPASVQEAFSRDFPRVVEAASARWGQDLPPPVALLAWGGGEGGLHNRGYAHGRQIAMQVQGAPYLEPEPEAMADLLWFFAHELHHQHQFVPGRSGDTWMIEGFADTLATATLTELGVYDAAALERRYWRVARECARELPRGPLQGAKGRAAYVCGELAGLVVEARVPGGLPAAWAATWALSPERGPALEALLEAMGSLGAPPEATAALERFVTETHADSDAAIAALLEQGGLEPVFVDGGLSSLRFPF